MTQQTAPKGASRLPATRRPRVMRPYEWTHAEGDFPEWLHRQGFTEDNWDPQTWAEHTSGGNKPGMR